MYSVSIIKWLTPFYVDCFPSWIIILRLTYLNYSAFSFSPGESQQQCGHVDSASLGTFACLPAGHSWHPHTCTAYEDQRAGAHRRGGSHVHQQPGHVNQIPRIQVKCMNTWTSSNSLYIGVFLTKKWPQQYSSLPTIISHFSDIFPPSIETFLLFLRHI